MPRRAKGKALAKKVKPPPKKKATAKKAPVKKATAAKKKKDPPTNAQVVDDSSSSSTEGEGEIPTADKQPQQRKDKEKETEEERRNKEAAERFNARMSDPDLPRYIPQKRHAKLPTFKGKEKQVAGFVVKIKAKIEMGEERDAIKSDIVQAMDNNTILWLNRLLEGNSDIELEEIIQELKKQYLSPMSEIEGSDKPIQQKSNCEEGYSARDSGEECRVSSHHCPRAI